MRILIVDDSRFTRALLRREFDGAYEVDEAGNGREALDVLGKHEPGIVLVDLLMPIMNGYEFVNAARRSGYRGPIVVCSANTQGPVEARVREMGATEFVTKPEILIPGKARAVVEEVLRRGASEPPPAPPPARKPDGLIGDAIHAAAEAIGSLAASAVQVDDATPGADGALRRVRAASEADCFHLRIGLGEADSGEALVLLKGDPAPEAATPPSRGPPAPRSFERQAFRLVQEFVQRFARRTGRELSVTGVRCAATGTRDGGRRPAAEATTLVADLALSGAAGGGTLEVSGSPEAWTRLRGAVPRDQGRH